MPAYRRTNRSIIPNGFSPVRFRGGSKLLTKRRIDMKADESKLRKNLEKQGKSIFCTMVLRLMDTEQYGNNYCKSLDLVLALFPEADREQLEKELDKYV